MSEVLHIRGMRRRLNARCDLRIDELTIKRGEVIHLHGDNGAGKTTLLRLLAQLARADSVAERRGVSAPPQLAYLHQTPYLFATSVRKNVEYGLRCCALPNIRQAAEAAMDWAGITHLAETASGKLSGGEQRRVALARLSALQPQLYLLDEPTAHLDQAARTRVLTLIETLQQKNAAIIIAAHNEKITTTTHHLHLTQGTLTQHQT